MIKRQFVQHQRPKVGPKRMLGLAVVVIVCFLLLMATLNVAGKYFAIRSNIRDLKSQQATLAQKESALKSTNDYLATPEGEEHALREKYNVVRPGEGMIVVGDTEMMPAPQEQSSRVSRWWKALLHGIGIKKE